MTLAVYLKFDALPLVDQQGHTVNDVVEYTDYVGLDTVHRMGTSGSSLSGSAEFPEYQQNFWVGEWDTDHLGTVTNGKLTLKTCVYNPNGWRNPVDDTDSFWLQPLGGPANYSGTLFYKADYGYDPADLEFGGRIKVYGGSNVGTPEFIVTYNLPPGEWVEIAVYYDAGTAYVFADGVFLGQGSVTPIPEDTEFVTDGLSAPLGDMRIDEHKLYFDEADPPIAPPAPPPAEPPPVDESPTGIRYPADLPGPLRENFMSTREDSRSAFEPAIGRPRRRNTMRFAPYKTQACFQYTAVQYRYFDQWWHQDTLGGARQFDIELPLNYNSNAWFTCECIGEPSAEALDGGYWRVTMQLRSKFPMFYYRPSGTDELYGTTSIGITNARGNLELSLVLYGKADIQVTPRGRLLPIGMYGLASGSGIQTARGRFFGTPNLLKGAASIVVTPTGMLEELP
jgi:hypothetical protein